MSSTVTLWLAIRSIYTYIGLKQISYQLLVFEYLLVTTITNILYSEYKVAILL